MSIYRHYKGNLYFVEGYATPFSDKVYRDVPTTIEVVAVAKYEPTLEDVEVILIHDGNVNATYYAYKSDDIDGVMVFYRGTNGQFWLRPKDNFHEDIAMYDIEMGDSYYASRFEKVSGEYLFDTISELLSNK